MPYIAISGSLDSITRGYPSTSTALNCLLCLEAQLDSIQRHPLWLLNRDILESHLSLGGDGNSSHSLVTSQLIELCYMNSICHQDWFCGFCCFWMGVSNSVMQVRISCSTRPPQRSEDCQLDVGVVQTLSRTHKLKKGVCRWGQCN